MKPENKVLQEAGVEITYTTGQAASVFRKTRQWMLWSLSTGRFLGEDNEPIDVGMLAGQYMWTGDNLKWAAISCYKRRTIDMNELKRIIRRVIRDTGEINERY